MALRMSLKRSTGSSRSEGTLVVMKRGDAGIRSARNGSLSNTEASTTVAISADISTEKEWKPFDKRRRKMSQSEIKRNIEDGNG